MSTRLIPQALPICLLLLSLAHAEPPKEAAFKYLSPDEAISKMKSPEGFVVNAFAAEPDCQQPFAFTFDERGRIWLCENLNYETRRSDLYNLGPQGRIVILTDTDGDGEMDERKVFKDKIMFPTGIALGHGGVWVGSPPNLLFIPDRNRDDIPDAEPEIKLDGWGRQDRHETLNSFLWGPDGWLYGTHGVFTHSNVGKPGAPDSERQKINAGVWRYHPLNEKFEVFAYGTSNPWGLDFDENGQAFVTACVIPHMFHIIQGGRYHRQAGRHFNPYVYDDIKTIADHRHPSAHGGARFYLADQFPEKYRKKLFMCNIHMHGVLVDEIKRKGSGYVASDPKFGGTFSMSNDPQWLGFNMEIGPDGSLYAIDWHDSDICGRKVLHRKTGRIWRYSWGKQSFPVGMDLTKLPDEELVEMHLHPNEWYVRQSRRLLQERALAGKIKPATLGGLRKILDEHEDPARRLRALWTLQLVGGLGDVMLAPLLNDKAEYIRAWAIQLIAEDRRVPDAVLEKWAVMAREDKSAVVRLFLASAMQRVDHAKRWDVLTALVGHVEDKSDHNLPLLIWYALEPLVVTDEDRTAEVVAACKIPKVSEYIARRRKAGGKAASVKPRPKGPKAKPAKSVSGKGLVLHLKAEDIGSSEEWGGASQPQKAFRPAVVASLGGRRAFKFDGADDRLEIAHREDLAFGKNDAYSLATWVYIEGTGRGWTALVNKSRAKSDWYGVWINEEGHWLMGGQKSNVEGTRVTRGWHHVCITQDKSERFLFVDGHLAAYGAGSVAADGGGALWIGGAPSVEEFFNGGINEVRIYRRALSAGEVSRLSDQPVGLASQGARAEENTPELFAHYRELLSEENLSGADLEHGHLVFSNSCGRCHAVNGEGGLSGPALNPSDVADLDYLLPHVLDPDGEIDESYRYFKFELTDERVVLGVIAGETAESYTLDSNVGRFDLSKADVAHVDVLPYSLMPDAVFQTMTDREVLDLVGFLRK